MTVTVADGVQEHGTLGIQGISAVPTYTASFNLVSNTDTVRLKWVSYTLGSTRCSCFRIKIRFGPTIRSLEFLANSIG